jgi:hypothetical protein
MAKCALLIHGISHFNEEQALQSARAMLSASGYLAEDVTAFNWDLIVGDPEVGAEDPFNLRFLAEIGAGLLESAHLGFFESKYADQRSWVLQIHNFLAFLLQCFACLFPFWLAIAFRTHTTLFVCLIVSAVLILMFLLASITGSRRFFNANTRRIALVCAWPIAYAIMVPIFVPGSLLLALFVAVSFSPFSLLSSSVEPDSILHFFQGFAAFVLTAGVPTLLMFVLLGFLPLLPIGLIAKLMADVVRYIGLPKYRSSLIQELSRQVTELRLDENSEFLLMTHSLGTVIAVDYLAQLPPEIAAAKSVTLITMGSPLQRYVSRFFPGIYPSPRSFAAFFMANLPAFRWINIFRRNDPIGNTLGSLDGGIVNCNTREELGRLAAHCNYFSSPPVYRCLAESIGIPNQIGSGTKTIERLAILTNVSDTSALGWSSGSAISSGWSKRKSVLDFLSRLVPPMGFRHILLWLVLSFGTIAWGLHQEKVWMDSLLLNSLRNPGAPWPTPDRHGLRTWTNVEIMIIVAPIIWALALDPFLRLALVSIDSYPSVTRGSPQDERASRAQIKSRTQRRLLSLAKPTLILLSLFVFLLVTHYWS